MSRTLLKKETSYLETEAEDILEAPDLTLEAPGKFLVEANGLPVLDPNNDYKPLLVHKA